MEEAIAFRERELEQERAEVDRGQAKIGELERVAGHLSDRVVLRERELQELRGELLALRTDREEGMAAVARQVDEIRSQARGQATRIRMRALQEAAEISERVQELAKRPGEAGGKLLDSLEDAIRGVGEEEGDGLAATSEVARAAPQRGDTSDAQAQAQAQAQASSNGHREAIPEGLFEGMIRVEVGPLHDFSQLVGFEDAANAIGGASEISVKRFTRGRATVEMRLDEPVALLRELEERAPFEFKVRDMRSDGVVLDVEDDAPTGEAAA